MKFIYTLSILTLLFGCGQQGKNTSLKVSIGAISGSSDFPNGLIISGTNDQRDSFVRKVAVNDEIEIKLPNGNWRFAAIGWSSSNIATDAETSTQTGNNLTGTNHCDFKNNIKLEGEQINLNMNLTTSKCANNIFGEHIDANKNFYTLDINSCIGIKNKISLNKSTTNNSLFPSDHVCNSEDDNPFFGGQKSFKILIPEFIQESSGKLTFLNNELSSDCITTPAEALENSDYKVSSQIKLPFSSSDFSLPVIVKAYSDDSCKESSSTYQFNRGLKDVALSSEAIAIADTQNKKFILNLHVGPCSSTQNANSTYPQKISGHYVICSANQFLKIASDDSSAPVNGIYLLGADINLQGSSSGNNAYITSFKGVFDGQGYVIKNAQKPLFNKVTNYELSSNSRIYVGNFNLVNSQVSLTASDDENFGLIANDVESDNDTNAVPIMLDKIVIKPSSSLSVTTETSSGAYGGLVGKVNHSQGNGKIRIKNNRQYAKVITSSSGYNVGGLVGSAIGVASTTTATVLFQNNTVGLKTDYDTSSTRVQVKGKTYVGGLVGYLKDADVLDGNQVFAKITGDKNIGGIAGVAIATQSDGKIQIRDSQADITFEPASSAENVGAIAGLVDQDSDVTISGTLSSLKIDSTDTIKYIGGVVGNADADVSGSTNSNLKIMNAKVHIDSKCNGKYHGGIIGAYSSESFNYTNSYIKSTYVFGKIKVDSDNVDNKYRGGIAGDAKHLPTRFILADIEIEGDSYLGGAFGTSEKSVLEEVHITSSIESLNSSAYTGGAIGKDTSTNLINAANKHITNSKFYTDITCDTNASSCGSVVGDVSLSNSGYLASQNNIIIDESSTSLDQCGAACNLSNSALTSSDSNCNSLSLGGLFEMHDSVCTPLFHKKWSELGLIINDADNTPEFLAGNALEPFEINNASDWNKIGSDFFLMDKTFKLTADIDFYNLSANDLIPIATSNPFKGTFIPNGKKLKNPDITFDNTNKCFATNLSPTEHHCGLFGKINNAHIGRMNDPLIIENAEFNFDYNSLTTGGIIGVAIGHSAIRIVNKGANFTTPNSITYLGGIVGQLSNSNLYTSSFTGKIDAPNASFAGGLVGHGNNNFLINTSFVNLQKMTVNNNANAGGFIGNNSEGSYDQIISNSYLTFDISGDSDISISQFGGVVGSLNNDIKFNTSYLDFTNLNDKNIESNIQPFAGSVDSGTFYLSPTSGTNFAVIGSGFDNSINAWPTTGASINYLNFESHSDFVDANESESVFRINRPLSPWTIGSDGKLQLFWENP